MAGHTPADENYQPVHPGDLRGQYKAILDALTFQLKEAGATWDDVVFRRMYAVDVPAFMEIVRDPTFQLPWHPDRPSPSTLIGVTALSNPGFLLEIEIVAMVRWLDLNFRRQVLVTRAGAAHAAPVCFWSLVPRCCSVLRLSLHKYCNLSIDIQYSTTPDV